MPVIIGTDEAGYGPNLGPLVITATAWEVPEGSPADVLWEQLEPVVSQNRSRRSDQLHVADSKQVYSSASSISSLETSVLAFFGEQTVLPDTAVALGSILQPDGFAAAFSQEPWSASEAVTLPVEADPAAVADFRNRIGQALGASQIRLRSIRSRIMFTPEFNSLVSQDGSKGLVLSKATLKLVRDALDDIGTQASGNVICDKHGGRNRYDDLISSAFDDEFVFRLEESSARSRYRMGQMEFCFQTRAEEHLPVALASMVSKYVREIMMMHFNQFWRAHLPNLKPTKGYPLDARRFWKATAQTAQRLQIERSQLWRQR